MDEVECAAVVPAVRGSDSTEAVTLTLVDRRNRQIRASIRVEDITEAKELAFRSEGFDVVIRTPRSTLVWLG